MRAVIDDLRRDLAHGARRLRRTPGFAGVVLGTLAVAIAATVTSFSIVDAWLFRPLNFPQADRLVIAFAASPDRPSEPAVWMPYRAYLGWKDQSRSFTSVSAAFFNAVTVTTATDARSALGLEVSPEFFETFGVPPLLGRTLGPSDVSGPRVVVLSYGFWLRDFGGSPSALDALSLISFELGVSLWRVGQPYAAYETLLAGVPLGELPPVLTKLTPEAKQRLANVPTLAAALPAWERNAALGDPSRNLFLIAMMFNAAGLGDHAIGFMTTAHINGLPEASN
jgi:hypothetical protein